MRNIFSLLLLFSFSTATLAASLLPLQLDVSAGISYDDNVPRAWLDEDIETDTVIHVDGYARYKFPATGKSYFALKATLNYNQFLEFGKLSNTRAGFFGSYHIRPFTGYTATSFFLLAGYERRYYNSDQRDGSATSLQLGLSKRLTDKLSTRAGYIREQVSANSVVFEGDTNRLYLDLDLKTGRHNTVYTTFGYLDGNLVSTGRNVPGVVYEYWVIDDAFTDLKPVRWAYRFTGSSAMVRLGDNYAIDLNRAIDASVFYYDSKSDTGPTYTGLIYNVNFAYRF